MKVSNLIRKAAHTFADDLQVNHATYIFVPRGNEENINVRDLPPLIRQHVSKVRTGPISIVSGSNLFAVANLQRSSTTSSFLKQIGADFNDLTVHAAYGRRLSKVKNKPLLYNAVRLTRVGKWDKPFRQQHISMTNPTLEYAKLRGRKFIRAWGNGSLRKKQYFVFLQKNLGSGGPFPTAAALDAEFISLRDYINYTTAFSGGIFQASPQFDDLVNRTRDIPLDEVRTENPNYRKGGAIDADGNPVFANVLVMAAATGDILPDLDETTGQALIAQGRGRVFGLPVGRITAHIYSGSSSKKSRSKRFAHLEVDAKVRLPKWGATNLGDFDFRVRKDGNKFAMTLNGNASVGSGPIRFNENVAIRASNSGFAFSVARNCPLRPFEVSAAINGYKIGSGSGFRFKKLKPQLCLPDFPDPAEIAKAADKAAKQVASLSKKQLDDLAKKAGEAARDLLERMDFGLGSKSGGPRYLEAVVQCANVGGNPRVRANINWNNRCVKNLAFRKKATQSSTAYGGVASRAVDGITDGVYASRSVTHTQKDKYPWREIDLGGLYRLNSVIIYNRVEAIHRLSGAIVAMSPTISGHRLMSARARNENGGTSGGGLVKVGTKSGHPPNPRRTWSASSSRGPASPTT